MKSVILLLLLYFALTKAEKNAIISRIDDSSPLVTEVTVPQMHDLDALKYQEIHRYYNVDWRTLCSHVLWVQPYNHYNVSLIGPLEGSCAFGVARDKSQAIQVQSKLEIGPCDTEQVIIQDGRQLRTLCGAKTETGVLYFHEDISLIMLWTTDSKLEDIPKDRKLTLSLTGVTLKRHTASEKSLQKQRTEALLKYGNGIIKGLSETATVTPFREKMKSSSKKETDCSKDGDNPDCKRPLSPELPKREERSSRQKRSFTTGAGVRRLKCSDVCGAPARLNRAAISEALPSHEWITKKFPWLGTLYVSPKDRNSLRFREGTTCGVSLISSNHALTAAHCIPAVPDDKLHERLTVIFGDQLTQNKSEKMVIPVEEVIVNTDFNNRQVAESEYYDMALLKLQNPVYMTETMYPACLGAVDNYFDQTVGVLGHGSVYLQDKQIPHPVEIELMLRTPSYCKKHKDYHYEQYQACADYEERRCYGGSGGPLFVEDDGLHHILGVTTSGSGCATPDKPALFTTISGAEYFINAFTDYLHCFEKISPSEV